MSLFLKLISSNYLKRESYLSTTGGLTALNYTEFPICDNVALRCNE